MCMICVRAQASLSLAIDMCRSRWSLARPKHWWHPHSLKTFRQCSCGWLSARGRYQIFLPLSCIKFLSLGPARILGANPCLLNLWCGPSGMMRPQSIGLGLVAGCSSNPHPLRSQLALEPLLVPSLLAVELIDTCSHATTHKLCRVRAETAPSDPTCLFG